MRLLILAMVLGACRTPKPLKTIRVAVDTVEAQQGVPVIGPVAWVHDDGLSVDLPEGWSGVSAPGHALRVTHTQTGVKLEVHYPYTDTPGDCGVEGWQPVRVGSTRSRALEAVGPTESWSATSPDPNGATRDCWSVSGADQLYLLAVEYPFGAVVAGRGFVQEILRNVRAVPAPVVPEVGS